MTYFIHSYFNYSPQSHRDRREIGLGFILFRPSQRKRIRKIPSVNSVLRMSGLSVGSSSKSEARSEWAVRQNNNMYYFHIARIEMERTPILKKSRLERIGLFAIATFFVFTGSLQAEPIPGKPPRRWPVGVGLIRKARCWPLLTHTGK